MTVITMTTTTMMMIFDDHVEVGWFHLAAAVLYVLVILAVVKKCL